MAYSVKEVAARLEITPSKLRKWNTHFADYLSSSTSRRLYTEDDIALLVRAKSLLDNGYSYAQVCSDFANTSEYTNVQSTSAHQGAVSEDLEMVNTSSVAIHKSHEGAGVLLSVRSRTVTHSRRRRRSALNPKLARSQREWRVSTPPRSAQPYESDQEPFLVQAHEQILPRKLNFSLHLSYRTKITLVVCIVGILLSVVAGASIALLTGT